MNFVVLIFGGYFNLVSHWRFLSVWELKRLERRARNRPDDAFLASNIAWQRTWLKFGFDWQWDTTQNWLDSLENSALKIEMAQSVAIVALFNGRLLEARVATEYVLSTVAIWAGQNPQNARRGLRLSQRLESRLAFIKPRERDKLLRQAAAHGLFYWKKVFDARLMLGFIGFIESEAKNGNTLFPRQSKLSEKRPHLPKSLHLDAKFARRVSMPNDRFKRLKRDAANIDFDTFQASFLKHESKRLTGDERFVMYNP